MINTLYPGVIWYIVRIFQSFLLGDLVYSLIINFLSTFFQFHHLIVYLLIHIHLIFTWSLQIYSRITLCLPLELYFLSLIL